MSHPLQKRFVCREVSLVGGDIALFPLPHSWHFQVFVHHHHQIYFKKHSLLTEPEAVSNGFLLRNEIANNCLSRPPVADLRFPNIPSAFNIALNYHFPLRGRQVEGFEAFKRSSMQCCFNDRLDPC